MHWDGTLAASHWVLVRDPAFLASSYILPVRELNNTVEATGVLAKPMHEKSLIRVLTRMQAPPPYGCMCLATEQGEVSTGAIISCSRT